MGFWRKLSTDLSTGKRLKALEDQLEVLTEHLRRHESELKRLDGSVLELDQGHRKLRGKVYAEGLHKPPADFVPPTREERRIQALRGKFQPGRPVAHAED